MRALRQGLLVAAVTLSTGFASAVAAPVPGTSFGTPEIAGRIASEDRIATATAEMRYCAELGPKRPGSEANREFGRHIAARFRAAGLKTHMERFHMPSFRARTQRIEITSPVQRRVRGESFMYAGSGVVRAPVVYVGHGRESDYVGVDARDKIVMVDNASGFHRTAQLREIHEHGGAAMLYVSAAPDNLVQTGTVAFAQDFPAPIPAVTVGSRDGDRLKELASGDRPLRMRLSVDARRTDVVGRNVIGVRRGTTYPNRYIVVGGHYDTWHGGSVDNCSSMGSMLQLVEQLRRFRPAYTVIFAAWDAEEAGLVGSYNWVRRHQNMIPRVVMNQNLEMTSAASYIGGHRLDHSLVNLMFGTLSPGMHALVYGAAARNAFTPAPTTVEGVRAISGNIVPTDLQPFYTQGVQGFSTYSSTPYYHTREESPDKIDDASHLRVTDFLRDVLVDAQQLPPEAFAGREVPVVEVRAPRTARPGSGYSVTVVVTDPEGRPVDGVPVRVLVNQRDHWAVAAGRARPLGEGRYRFHLRDGRTTSDLTYITATVSTDLYGAEGYARVDQRR